jgi:hypothetical protein
MEKYIYKLPLIPGLCSFAETRAVIKRLSGVCEPVAVRWESQ